ncbi:MAG: hypothetical protein LUG50_07370 [Planctomycetaceae bacterium]|nr:hypothetical protein [Planctomycetaceae bacterium]
MGFGDADYLLEALCSNGDEVDHPMLAETEYSPRKFNWLDATPADKVPEIADKALLTLARLMAVRGSAMLEEAFNANGYSGYMPVNPDPIPEPVFHEAELHLTFYRILITRLAGLAHKSSLNPGLNAGIRSHKAETINMHGRHDSISRSLHEEYERRRRSNIMRNRFPITSKPGRPIRDFLTNATAEQIDESADVIVLATAARMAVRASLRLEKTWRSQNVFLAGKRIESPPLPVLIGERDRFVDQYLWLREELAEVVSKLSLPARANVPASCRLDPHA